MPDKPSTSAGYPDAQVDHVRGTCLYVATKLGDLMDDIVVVGGLVPSLLIDQNNLAPGVEHHVGTLDLDIALAVAVLDDERYKSISSRLREAGFIPDTNEAGKMTRQRWRIDEGATVLVDFLIQPSQPEDKGGQQRYLEQDWAATIVPGLHLAFDHRTRITLDGRTILGEKAHRDIWVCGPGAFVVLKTLAFGSRGQNKDAYDLYYLLRSFGLGADDVAAEVRALLPDPSAQKALEILRDDFTDLDATGPARAARFLADGREDEIKAELVSGVGKILSLADSHRDR